MDPESENRSFHCSDVLVSNEELTDAITKLEPKNSTDHDGISMNFLKQHFDLISAPFKHIVDLSFRTGCVPKQLKIAKVIPVFKSGDPRQPNNYRPISLLSNFSKILEKIMANRLTNYLENNNILSPSQFGFRKNHATIHPMTLLDNFVSEALNNKKYALAIFCDLRKAFDTVNHTILLSKLEKLGIKNQELCWFENYLSNRWQFVSVGGVCSSLQQILLGVPQGSILGPLLFLIYINDLPSHSKLFALLFADDTTLLAQANSPAELFTMVNEEFYKITCYFRKNLLSIHPDKTNYILFQTSKNNITENFNIFLNFNNPTNYHDPDKISIICCANNNSNDPTVKFLGLYIDSNLSYSSHTSIIRKKLSNALYFMRTAKNLLNVKYLTALYYSLFHTHLIYAIQIWSSCSSDIINKLFKLQKKLYTLYTPTL